MNEPQITSKMALKDFTCTHCGSRIYAGALTWRVRRRQYCSFFCARAVKNALMERSLC